MKCVGEKVKQNILTVLVPILPSQLMVLKKYLDEIGNDIENNSKLRFRDSQSTHFARWVIIDSISEIKPLLYFSACFDGELDAYIAELSSKIGDGMEGIWLCCEGYTSKSAKNPKKFKEFLDPYSYDARISLVAFPGLTVRKIFRNSGIRKLVDDSLDAIQDRVFPETPSIMNAVLPAKHSYMKKFLDEVLSRLVDCVVGVRRGVVPSNTMIKTDKNIVKMEDMVIQNQLTVITKIKPGLWSRFFLKFFLFLGRKFNKPSSRGEFSGLTTIHFGRWVLFENGNYLLFESSYDGSWESYIDDFCNYASVGMNAVWGSSIGFPKGGSRDIASFKQGIRANQHPAQVFYSAYPDLTVANIATDMQLSENIAPARKYFNGSYW